MRNEHTLTWNGEKAQGDARSSTVCAIDHKVTDLEDGKDLSDHQCCYLACVGVLPTIRGQSGKKYVPAGCGGFQ